MTGTGEENWEKHGSSFFIIYANILFKKLILKLTQCMFELFCLDAENDFFQSCHTDVVLELLGSEKQEK